MSKSQNSKKSSKKEPAKTMKEKKAAKREKKNEKMNQGLIEQIKVWDALSCPDFLPERHRLTGVRKIDWTEAHIHFGL